DPRRLFNETHLVAQHYAVDLGPRAAAQDDRNVVRSGAGQRPLEPVGHRQEGEQHHHDQRNRNYRRDRQPEPPRDALDVDHRHRGDLQQQGAHGQPLPSAAAIRSRNALSAGSKPVTMPRPIISATAASTIPGVMVIPGTKFDRLSRSDQITISATRRPGMPPSKASSTDPPRRRRATRAPVNPRVFSPPIARVRSRTAMIMELPTIIRMVANAAPTTSSTMSAMLPSCAANALLNAFSVSVEVS